jgi:hypothetical protein
MKAYVTFKEDSITIDRVFCTDCEIKDRADAVSHVIEKYEMARYYSPRSKESLEELAMEGIEEREITSL